MRASITVDIDAPAERVWAVMSDVETWPQWTPSIKSIRRLDPGPLRVGARIRIKQPRLPTTTWTVTEVVDGESFTWAATGPGVHTSAHHRINRTTTGSRAMLSIDQQGILGQLLARVSTGLTDRYLCLEAAGLKRRSEQLTHNR
jgi:uncharacterized protein YndB with AHSA1/START domain